jgi:hypothetical protein
MNYYLVDYENVGSSRLKGLTNIAENDTLIIFFSKENENVSLDTMDVFGKLNIKFRCFKVDSGTKNALDFQLSSYLGYLISQNNEKAHYYIISADTGYDCLQNFWKSQGVSVSRFSPVLETAKPAENTAKAKKKAKKKSSTNISLATLEDINKYISAEDEPEFVLQAFNESKLCTDFNTKLNKHYKDSKHSSKVYRAQKPLLKGKNKK